MTEEERLKEEEAKRQLEELLSGALTLAKEQMPTVPVDDSWKNDQTKAWEQFYQAETDRTPKFDPMQVMQEAAIVARDTARQEEARAEAEPDFWRIPSRDEVKEALNGVKMGGEPTVNASTMDPNTQLPTDVVDLLQGLEDPKQRKDDPIYKSGLLPLQKNQRTGQLDWNLTEAGPLGQIKQSMDLAKQYTMIDQTTPATDELSGAIQDLEADQIRGEFGFDSLMNSIGMTSSRALIGPRVQPGEITAGFGLPAKVKNMMKGNKITAPVTFKITDIDPHAPKNLESLETFKDVMKAHTLDTKQVLMDLGERAGIPNMGDVATLIAQDTQSTALTRVNEALRSGKLVTDKGQITFRTPPEMLLTKYKALPDATQKGVDAYLKNLDYSDDLRLAANQKLDPAVQALAAQGDKGAIKKVAAHAKMVQTANTELARVRQEVTTLRQQFPEAQLFETEYKQATRAVRNFLSFGRNAIFSRKALQKLHQERPNYVPIDISGVNPAEGLLSRIADANKAGELVGAGDWFVKKRDLTAFKGIDNRIDAVEMLVDYARNALRHKMENDVRGAFIDGLRASTHGRKTIRRMAGVDAQKHSGRLVEVYEGGRKRLYATSQLQADLLRFDPYIAKHTWAYIPKRLMEHGTTGALSLTFAPMTAIRDTITGAVLAEKGLAKPGPLSMLKAIPQQVVPRMALEASTLLKGSFSDLPFFDPQSIARMSDKLAKHYANSLYALANRTGGMDASLMKSNIEAGRGAMREIGRTADFYINKVPGGRKGVDALRMLASGWDALFGAISDSPRFAVFAKEVKKGGNFAKKAVMAREIAGDTGRTGMNFKADANRTLITGDVKNKAAMALVKPVGHTVAFLREATPYFNPSVQGMRRLASRLVENPMQVNYNAWKYVGLPALAAAGWNEWLGPEYNDYANQQRTPQDQAMNIYIALPGLPPERGLEIPIGHEMTLWNSLWTKALWLQMREDPEMGEALMNQGLTVLQNGSNIGVPTAFAVPAAAAGIRVPNSLGDLLLGEGATAVRDNDNGLLSENTEKTIRAMFGGISDTVMQTVAAGYEGGPEAFFDELSWQMGRKTPIVKNLIGSKYAVTAFTPKQEQVYRKIKAFEKFNNLYEQWYGEGADSVDSKLTQKTENLSNYYDEDVTLRKLGPNLSTRPVNPVFKLFGDAIKEKLGTKEYGMTALKDRYNALNKQIVLLKGYHAGRRDAFAEHQKTFDGAMERYAKAKQEADIATQSMTSKQATKFLKKLKPLEEAAKAEKLMKDLKIDLSKRTDVVRLVNYLEGERFKLASEQMKVITQVEDEFTLELQKLGMLKPEQKFDLEKHLDPNAFGSFQQGDAAK